MMSREIAGLRRPMAERRQRDSGLPAGCSERRRQAEQRDIRVTPLSLVDWAEAACNYYYQAPGSCPPARRWSLDRRVAERPPPGDERRLRAERRRLAVVAIPLADWAEAMANFYYHYPRR
jgi:hypothetical protein